MTTRKAKNQPVAATAPPPAPVRFQPYAHVPPLPLPVPVDSAAQIEKRLAEINQRRMQLELKRALDDKDGESSCTLHSYSRTELT